ncbi:MAG: ATP-binding protein [Anaerolineae bacterium]
MARRVVSGSNPESIEEALQQREAELRALHSLRSLHESALAITAPLDSDQVLGEIVHRSAQLIDDASILIYLTNASIISLELVAGSHTDPRSRKSPADRAAGQRAEDPARVVPDYGEGPAGRAAASGHSILVAEAAAEDERLARFGAGRVVRSLVAVPLIYSGEVLGVLEAGSPREGGITQAIVSGLEMIASHAAIGISHARLFERSREMLNLMQGINDRTAAVSSVAQAILDAGHELHRMLADALQRILSLLGLKAGSILLANPTGHELHVVVHYRFPQDEIVLAPVQTIRSDSRGLAARVALERQPIAVRDVEHDALTQPALDVLRRFNIGAIAGLPMMAEEVVVGVLLVASEDSAALEAGSLDTLRVIAGVLAQGVANTRLFSRIRADQEKFKAVISSSGDVVLSLDQQGRLTLANDAARRAFGFMAHEAIGQPLSRVTTNVALNSAVEQAIRKGIGIRERIGFEVPLADESVLFCNLSPIADEDGQVVGWVAVMQDITRFKETERMKSDMILTASHDLRNPVHLTLGALDLLGQRATSWTPEQQEMLDIAVMGVRRIEALISDLLDLERVERRVGLVLGECNLTEIARTVFTENRMQAQSKHQLLEAHLAEGLPPVWGDAQRLYQVVSNLVGNAIKYTPANGRITINLHREDDQILLEVNDTGNGIPQEAQVHIFERFYRVAGSSLIDATGAGLGLALVKTIVDQHGGQVWVTSQVGHGSTFSVSLPVWSPPARDGEPASR